MEIRKDYILDRYVIISQSRGKRPHQFSTTEAKEERVCMFCPGNESMTPEEILRVHKPDGGWRIRSFPNKFAAVEQAADARITTENVFFTHGAAYGFHEVIVETDDHTKQLWDLSVDDLSILFSVYKRRVADLLSKPNILYVSLFKNSGKDAGTSIVHTHTQLIATHLYPPAVLEELDALKKETACMYCSVVAREKESVRRCFENNSFVAFTPYASRFQYELWIFPKQHISSFLSFSDETMHDLALILYQVLRKLKAVGASYNYIFHYAQDPAYHFHIEILPRLALFAGFEYTSGILINSVAPEEAAAFYRGEQ